MKVKEWGGQREGTIRRYMVKEKKREARQNIGDFGKSNSNCH